MYKEIRQVFRSSSSSFYAPQENIVNLGRLLVQILSLFHTRLCRLLCSHVAQTCALVQPCQPHFLESQIHGYIRCADSPHNGLIYFLISW